MKLGALLMPSHPPEQAIADGQRWDLEELERLDALGFEEAWIGEHFTAAWEPCPAPDLLIAQALVRTERLNLGPLGHLLPYHNPIELAHRVAYLDHLAEGHYRLGVGVSAKIGAQIGHHQARTVRRQQARGRESAYAESDHHHAFARKLHRIESIE